MRLFFSLFKVLQVRSLETFLAQKRKIEMSQESAYVTGGASGIGKEVVRMLVKNKSVHVQVNQQIYHY